MIKKSAFILIALTFVTVSLAQAAEWMFDTAHSSIEFKVKHLMITNVRGSFNKFDGKVEYDPADPAKAMIDITVDVASISTGVEDRDNHLRSPDFFDVEKFPTMTFKSTKINKTEEGLKIVGNLTIHGVTREVVLSVDELSEPIKGPMGGTRIGAAAHTKIDRRDFGLTWSKTVETGALVVDNDVKIMLEVELVKK